MTDREPTEPELDLMLRGSGLRATSQRRAVLAVLLRSDDHPTAEEVLSRVRRTDAAVSLATAYRTLASLESHGLVQKISMDNAPARFEIRPRRNHDHLLDVDTGELSELRSAEIDEVRRRVLDQLGYEVLSHSAVIRVRRRRPA